MALSAEAKDKLTRQLIDRWRARRGHIEQFAADGTWRLIEPQRDKTIPPLPDFCGH